jgi:hypothetical protein
MPAAIAIVASAAISYASAREQGKAAEDAADAQAAGVEAGQQQQREFTQRAVNQLGTNYQNARTALLSGQEQFGRIFDESGNIISGGYDRARGDITSGAMGAESVLSPLYQRGESASDLQAAYTGLMGSDAQQRAFDQFKESPGTDFLRKKQEEARLRTFSRLGGGLGNQASVMSALAEDEFGRAQTDFGNQYDRLSGIALRGDNAASNIANIRSSLGTQLGNLSTGEASALAGLVGTRAGAAQSTMQNIADLYANEGTNIGNVYVGAGSQQAQLAQNLGAARAGADIYAAQNTPAWAQGLQSGMAAYGAMGGGGMGGGFASLFGGGGGAGATSAGYTGQAYQNWLGR